MFRTCPTSPGSASLAAQAFLSSPELSSLSLVFALFTLQTWDGHSLTGATSIAKPKPFLHTLAKVCLTAPCPRDLVQWQNLQSLDLAANPLHCDCQLAWLRDVLTAAGGLYLSANKKYLHLGIAKLSMNRRQHVKSGVRHSGKSEWEGCAGLASWPSQVANQSQNNTKGSKLQQLTI